MPSYNVNISSYQAFRTEVLGNGYDIDGQYGYQCWDGVDLLYSQIGRTLSTGGTGLAYGCWTNENARAENGAEPFSIIYNLNDIKRGDIVVLNPGLEVGSAGHIAFADDDYRGDGRLNLLGQNQGPSANPTVGVPFNITSLSMQTFLGGFRYGPWNGGGPTPPTPTKKKKRRFPWPVAWQYWPNFQR